MEIKDNNDERRFGAIVTPSLSLIKSFSYEWESYMAPRLAVLKESDWMRCICTVFDWFRKEAI